MANNAKLIYSGLALLAAAFFIFYGSDFLGFQTPRTFFLVVAMLGFQVLTAGRVLVGKRKEILLLAVMDVAFLAAGISLIVYSSFSFGRWDYFLFMTILFIAFVTGGLLPTKKIRLQDYGITGALIASFFFEMFGFPLTLYILDVFVGTNYPLQGRSALEAAHLWITLGLISDYEAHFFSAVAIVIGLALIVVGHRSLHAAKGQIVTWGIYRYLKHPQYIGIIMLTGGMLIEYPTFVTLAMWAALIVMYTTKARKETKELRLTLNRSTEKRPKTSPFVT